MDKLESQEIDQVEYQQLLNTNQRYKEMLIEKENKLIELTNLYFGLQNKVEYNSKIVSPAVPSNFSVKRIVIRSVNHVFPLHTRRRETLKKIIRPFYKHG